jgi:hypothetical protein
MGKILHHLVDESYEYAILLPHREVMRVEWGREVRLSAFLI